MLFNSFSHFLRSIDKVIFYIDVYKVEIFTFTLNNFNYINNTIFIN
ncbi:hypothetical protein CLOSPI_02027 [Thomasclavelia spiroformis DSM 1552]|uniref:Uncharacterized protein n=1 Tax=Thomasclavelia spiroformis DSM 1552 TaxID=428126 RepID=B1C459_9FIRM|nr:hypothetical protein CLOSPI_02027 [Thomasclavelia spiroformis DSM 1552]